MSVSHRDGAKRSQKTRTSVSILPPPVAELLRPQLADLAEETIAAISREVPAYARPMRGAFGRGVRIGVQRALQRFLDGAAGPGEAAPGSSVYVELGRGEFRVGRSLDALQSAYRVGARVCWRRIGDAAAAAGLEPAVLVGLGEAIFAYVDELAAESVEGFAAEQSAAAGRRDRARTELVALLEQPVAADAPVLAQLGAEAGWAAGGRVAAVRCHAAAAEALAAAAGAAVLLGGSPAAEAGHRHGFLADPSAPGLRERLDRALAGHDTWLGTAEPVTGAARSMARVRALAALHPSPAGPCWADDHLAELVVHADDGALARLAAHRLAPLDDLGRGPRTRMLATLGAYLDHQGSVTAMAPALHLHPQTVRYRMARLRERFGAALEDPATRFELALAMRYAGPQAASPP